MEYTIHAPAHTALKLVQSVGAIKSIGFTGDVQEHTSTGAIEATMAELRGSQQLHMDVSVGAIRLSLPAEYRRGGYGHDLGRRNQKRLSALDR